MSTVARALLTSTLVLAIAGSIGACLDTDPVVIVPDAASPPPIDAAPPIDAGPDVDLRPPCQKCIETPDMPGPGCGDELAICLADQKCHDTYVCMLGAGCLEDKTDQRQVVICGLPCAQDAGIMSQNEPSAMLITDVAMCAENACQRACQPYLFDGGDQ